MKAGRELDALVAEKIFGTEIHHYHGDWPFGPAGQDIPRYSTDLRSAWLVVEKLRGDWFSFKAWQPCKEPHEAGGKPVEIAVVSFVCGAGPCPRHNTDFDNHHGAYAIEAETFPLAVCKAALIAMKAIPAEKADWAVQ